MTRPWRNGEVRTFAHLLHGDPLPEGAVYADREEPDCHHRYWSRIIELPSEERNP